MQPEIILCHLRAGRPLSFRDFKERFWAALQLGRADYLERCHMQMRHDAPAPQGTTIGGDSVEGL